jgi:predicted dehydrogenase
MSPVRIAVAGAGLIGRRHVALIEASADCVLAGICDPSEAARDLAISHGTSWYRDLGALIASEAPNGVIIATPNTLHVSLAEQCLANGIPALIEKPIAENVAAAQRLLKASAGRDVPLLVGHHRRHNPLIKAVRETIAAGGLGRLTAVNALFLLKKPDDYFDVTWRREPGGGPILINLVHDIDNLRFICGEITEVQAVLANNARGFAVEDTAAVIFRFANGALGTALISDAVAAPWSWELTSGENRDYPQQDQHCYVFAGTQGSLSVPSGDTWSYGAESGWHAPLFRGKLDYTPADPLVEQLRHFTAVIGRSETPLISAEDGVRTLAVIEAIAISAREGRPVAPAEILEAVP